MINGHRRHRRLNIRRHHQVTTIRHDHRYRSSSG